MTDALSGRSGLLPKPNHNPNSSNPYLAEGLSAASKRAYRADLAHFLAWGGAMPATPSQVAQYLAEHAGRLSFATLKRRLAALTKAHRAAGFPVPTEAEEVRLTLRGIARAHGSAQRRAKPLTVAELLRITSAPATTRDKRDHALLLVGFIGAFRRSELVAIDVEDLAFIDEGVIVTIRRSKTDQEGQGREVAIPHGRGTNCPVRALTAWLAAASIESGPVFRRVTRLGAVGTARLSSQAVPMILKERIARTGGDPAGVSGHSLRAGFVTSAAKAGASSWKIRQQTGHKSDAMLARYIRDAELFSDNPASRLL